MGSFQAHRNILAGSSPVFEKLISQIGSNSALYLSGVSYNLESILQFMYLGETRIAIESFYAFVDICKELEIADWQNTDTINREISEELTNVMKSLISVRNQQPQEMPKSQKQNQSMLHPLNLKRVAILWRI